MAGDAPPRVFISYTWENDEHVAWVKALATRLRTEDGIDATLDQWAAQPGDELTHFMESGVRASRFVLPICTPLYKKKFDERLGGVGYEARTVTGEIFAGQAHRKIIPIHRRGEWKDAAPSVLLADFYVNLSGQPYAEAAYRLLVDTLHGRCEVAPPIGLGLVLYEGPGAAPVLAVPHFSGRDADLFALERQLRAGPAQAVCVVASGIGGVGKTSLVRQYVATRAAERFPEGSAWLDGSNLRAELARVARRFGWPEPTDPTPEAGATFLRRALHDRAFLLVVDNLPEAQDARLMPVAGGKSRTVITSRAAALAGALGVPAASLSLENWDRETSRGYLRALVPRLVYERDADLDRLCDFVGGLPLAVHLVARGLQRQRGRSATEHLASLQTEPLGTLERFATGSDRGVAATFLETYRSLPDGVQGVLRALAVCGKGTRTSIVAAVAKVSAAEGEEALNRLADASLAEFRDGAAAPWTLHDVVRLFVRTQPGVNEQAAEHLAWVRAHLDTHKDPFAHEKLEEGIAEALVAFDRTVTNADVHTARILLGGFASHLSRRGRYALLIDAAERLLSVAPPDGVAADMGLYLGPCYRILGDIPKAVESLERSLALYEKLGHLEGQATQLGNLGDCYEMGDILKTIDFHQRSLALNEKLGRLEGQATQLDDLGRCYESLGDLPKAIDFHQRALAIDEKLGRLQGQAAELVSLGHCYRTLGDAPKAIELLERSLALYEKLGSLPGQANSLGSLGACFQTLGDLPKAMDFHERALALHEKLGILEGQAHQIGCLGLCYKALGDLSKAIDHLDRARAVYEKLGLLEGQAMWLSNLGLCQRDQGRAPEARASWEQALRLHRRTGLGEDHRLIRVAIARLAALPPEH